MRAGLSVLSRACSPSNSASTLFAPRPTSTIPPSARSHGGFLPKPEARIADAERSKACEKIAQLTYRYFQLPHARPLPRYRLRCHSKSEGCAKETEMDRLLVFGIVILQASILLAVLATDRMGFIVHTAHLMV